MPPHRARPASTSIPWRCAVTPHTPPSPTSTGAAPRADGLARPERHLGLGPAGEHAALAALLERVADHVASAIDVEALIALTRRAALPAPAERVQPLLPLGRRIAVARDAAFAFLYPAIAEGWMRGG